MERGAGDDPRILFTLGLSVADAGDYERAAKLFRRTDALRPDTYEVLYNLGIALYNLDRLDEARAVLQRAATLAPDQPEVFYRLGLIASAKSESENALGLMQRAVKLRPVYPEASFMIAEELVKNGRVDRAHAVLRTGCGGGAGGTDIPDPARRGAFPHPCLRES